MEEETIVESQVFDTNNGMKNFLNRHSVPVDVKELIIDFGDCPISDKKLDLLLKCLAKILRIEILNLDLFACHCKSSVAI
jgi:hypothetical protein